MPKIVNRVIRLHREGKTEEALALLGVMKRQYSNRCNPDRVTRKYGRRVSEHKMQVNVLSKRWKLKYNRRNGFEKYYHSPVNVNRSGMEQIFSLIYDANICFGNNTCGNISDNHVLKAFIMMSMSLHYIGGKPLPFMANKLGKAGKVDPNKPFAMDLLRVVFAKHEDYFEQQIEEIDHVDDRFIYPLMFVFLELERLDILFRTSAKKRILMLKRLELQDRYLKSEQRMREQLGH